MEVDGLESEEVGSLGSKDSCHATIRAVRGSSTPRGVGVCGEKAGEGGRGWQGVGAQGPGETGAVISSGGDPTPEWRAAATQRQPEFRTGVSQPGEGGGGWCADVPAGWGRTQHFGSRLGAFKPLLVAGCLPLLSSVCVLISGCVALTAVQASSSCSQQASPLAGAPAFSGGGFSCCRAQPLSLAPGHVGFPDQDQTHVCCIGRVCSLSTVPAGKS